MTDRQIPRANHQRGVAVLLLSATMLIASPATAQAFSRDTALDPDAEASGSAAESAAPCPQAETEFLPDFAAGMPVPSGSITVELLPEDEARAAAGQSVARLWTPVEGERLTEFFLCALPKNGFHVSLATYDRTDLTGRLEIEDGQGEALALTIVADPDTPDASVLTLDRASHHADSR